MVHGSRSWVVDGSGSRGRMIDGCRGWMDSGFVLRVLGDSLVFHIGHVATITSLEKCFAQFNFHFKAWCHGIKTVKVE